MQNTKKIYTKLFLLAMVFVLPLLVSRFLFTYHEHFQFKTVNYGALVNPPINVNEVWKTDATKKQWQIVYAPTTCDEQCDKLMFNLHQLRLALGKDHGRLNLALAVSQINQPKDFHDFQKFIMTDSQYTQLQNSFSQAGAKNFATQDKIYLVDPLGNLFMYYPTSVNPMNILKDLKKVLEVSQIG